MATSARLFAVKAPSPVTYTQEEWKQNRGIITELWSSGMSQKEVLRVLAQDHDFRPSYAVDVITPGPANQTNAVRRCSKSASANGISKETIRSQTWWPLSELLFNEKPKGNR